MNHPLVDGAVKYDRRNGDDLTVEVSGVYLVYSLSRHDFTYGFRRRWDDRHGWYDTGITPTQARKLAADRGIREVTE